MRWESGVCNAKLCGCEGENITIIDKNMEIEKINKIEKNNDEIIEGLENVSGKVRLINKAGKVTTSDLETSLNCSKEKKIVAVDFNIDGIENGGEAIIGNKDQVLGYKKIVDGREFINIDHHIPLDSMKRKVSSTNLACAYVLNNKNTLSEDPYEVVAHHADVDSFLATLVLRGVIPPDKGIEEAAIAADHTGKDSAIADFLQASQEEEKTKISKSESNYQNTFKFLAENFAKVLQKIDINELYQMKSDELLGKLKDKKLGIGVDSRLIANLEGRNNKRKKVEELVKNVGKENGFNEIKEGSGVFYVDVDEEIDGELAPAVFAENGLNANIIVISYPYLDRRATKVRLGEYGMINKLDLQSLDLGSFVKAIDKNGNQTEKSGYGGRWNAGSDKRNGGSLFNGKQFAENILKLLENK